MNAIFAKTAKDQNEIGHAGLQAGYDEWHHAIAMSREGQCEAEILRTKLLQII